MGSYLELRKRADRTGDEPAEGEAWPLLHVELLSEPPAEHSFSDVYVTQGVGEGWISMIRGRLILSVVDNGEPREIVYAITRAPDKEYRACDVRLETPVEVGTDG